MRLLNKDWCWRCNKIFEPNEKTYKGKTYGGDIVTTCRECTEFHGYNLEKDFDENGNPKEK